MHIFIPILAVANLLVQRVVADANLVFDSEGYNMGRYGPDPHQYYYSANMVSSLLLVNHWDPDKTDNASHIFLTISNPIDSSSFGPVIYRADDLSLVYSDARWSLVHDAYIGRFKGSDYLVFLGQEKLAHSSSRSCLLYDATYTLAYNVSSPGPESASMGTHECQLTSTGSVLAILTEIIPFNLTAVGGPEDGKIVDNIVQEIDVESGELLWTWRASHHLSLSESYSELKEGSGAYDYAHINSAERTSEGNFLISARHTHSIILVDRESGEIQWRLGGKNNSFVDMSGGRATDFAWQHHARFGKDGQTQLTMFDNHDKSIIVGCTGNCTRGKHIELDYSNFTARLISEFYHPENLVSRFEGSYQTLQNGNVLLGWGANPTFTEHTSSGECVLDIQFDIWRLEDGYPANYRAFKMKWQAYPNWDPDIAAYRSGLDGQSKVYVSWNGATEVAMWQLLGGDTKDNVTQPLIAVPRAGFETEISLKTILSYVRAAALDKNGKILGTTAIIQLAVDGDVVGKS
ncbi:Arylsulfotransferase-domain-containing protein [Xylaria nigripes]|nr:Arylsulfotransferase-domain-containing protein [Xylaria nigripes]